MTPTTVVGPNSKKTYRRRRVRSRRRGRRRRRGFVPGGIYVYIDYIYIYIGRLLGLTYEKMPLRVMEAAYGLQDICPFG